MILARHRLAQDPHLRHDRFTLPAFDAYAYLAMAEHPPVFTVAPWGYRVLTPWLVHLLPVDNVARGFRYVTLSSLTLAGGLLFLFLSPAPGAVGVGALLALNWVAIEAGYHLLRSRPSPGSSRTGSRRPTP